MQTAPQSARPAPGTLGPRVGLKSPDYVPENLDLASRPPWNEEAFGALLP